MLAIDSFGNTLRRHDPVPVRQVLNCERWLELPFQLANEFAGPLLLLRVRGGGPHQQQGGNEGHAGPPLHCAARHGDMPLHPCSASVAHSFDFSVWQPIHALGILSWSLIAGMTNLNV